MVIKKLILKKMLNSGFYAEFNLVKNEGLYEVALFVNGKYVPGPSQPEPLSPPKGDITYWMGNRPSVGLTDSEVEKINEEVECENQSLRHREKKWW